MQTKYGENGKFMNKPKKMRQYLMQNSPYNQYLVTSSRNGLFHRSTEKDQTSRDSVKHVLKKELIQLVTTTKNKIKPENQKSKEKGLNVSVNIKKNKKTSMNIDIKNNPRSTFRNLSQVNLSLDSNKNSQRYSRAQRSIVFPFNSIERNEQNRSSISIDKPQYQVRKMASQKKGSQHIYNFKSKNHRSLHKMSAQIDQHRTKREDFLEGFTKEKRLGKGGFSVVWEAKQNSSGKMYAVKQINAFNQYQTHLSQIMFSTFFFEKGYPKQQFKDHQGINVLLQLQNYQISGSKAYIVYQKCTSSLGEILFDIYEQTQIDLQNKNEEKIYVIVHKPLYRQLRESCLFLKNFIYQIAQALDLLLAANIVHSDIKTSNILINLSDNMKRYSFKLIDYGSSFFFQHLKQYRLATPEYMPPQMINFLNKEKGRPFSQQILNYTTTYNNISAIDMWGLGCILIQIIHGVPLWLNNMVKIKVKNGQKIVSGLFATDSRIYSQILEKQIDLIHNIDLFLIEQNNTGVVLDDTLKTLIARILEIHPEKRIQPREIIQILNKDGSSNFL